MQKRNNRDQLVIATKYSCAFRAGHGDREILVNTMGNGTKSLHVSVEASLRKLQTSYIDLLYVHFWDYTASIEETMQSLNALVTAGKVLYLGVSDTPAWVVAKANAYARAHALRPFSVYQGRWSAEHRDLEREIIPMCVDEGMAICAFGALGGGNFKTAKQFEAARLEGAGAGRAGTPSEGTIKVAAVLEGVAERRGTAITSVALAYVMQKAPYVFPIVGGRNIEHLKGNIEALGLELSGEEIEEIEAAKEFDLGFPMNIFGRDPESQWVTAMAGKFQYVKAKLPIKPAKLQVE
jgi:aryl-alcohol dehydrogenase-like predicted oxidoreductase